MTAKNIDRRINQIDLMSRALAGMRLAADVPTMPREVIAYLAPFAHLPGDHDAVSFLVEALRAEACIEEGWIDVNVQLPKRDPNYARVSINVDAMADDGAIFEDAYCNIVVDGKFYGNWYNVGTANIIAWRPMRGGHD